MQVVLIAKPEQTHTGVGRYADTLHRALRAAGVSAARKAPALPPAPRASYALLRRLGVDARAFLTNYPVWVSYPRANVYHLTSQNLASILLFRRPRGQVIVTVHDIIPYILRDDPQLSSYRTVADRLFDRLALAGLSRAHMLVADSHYTKWCMVEHLGIPPEKIVVVHLGIDREHFRPLPVPTAIRQRYGLPEGRRYLIYVGSEDPRKNLATLVKALAAVRAVLPNVELIKVGRAHFSTERRRLTDLAEQLGVRTAIHFHEDLAEADLPLLYNLADVGVMPSLYEGFGFPALEAQACGTPVVCANATSLPEVVGDAGLLYEPGPHAVGALAVALLRVLNDAALYQSLRARGLKHAAAFDWSQTTTRMLDIYHYMCSHTLGALAQGPARKSIRP